MKRALTAAAFGGLVILFVPQAAFAGNSSAGRMVAHEGTGEASEGDEAPATSEQAPPREGHYDHEHHDGGESLF